METQLLRRIYQSLNATPVAPAALERAARASVDDASAAFTRHFEQPEERRAAVARFSALAELMRDGVLDVLSLEPYMEDLPPQAFRAATMTALRPGLDGTPSFDPCAYLRAYASAGA